jgi:outer membrane protein OmpA-like peptidoglycan-associated protein
MIRVVRKHKAVALVCVTLALLIGPLSALIYKRIAHLDAGQDVKSPAKMVAVPPAKSTVQRSQNTASSAGPVFDIVRIDPISGTSVLAGQAPPNSTVYVLQDGVVIGNAIADENGEWTLVTEYKFAAEPRLTLRAEQHATDGAQSIANLSSQTDIAPRSHSAAAVQARLLKNLEELVSSVREENASVPGDLAGGSEASRPVSASLPHPNQVGDPPRLAKVQEPTMLPAKTQTSIPIPILFVYREATFTMEGRQGVSLLLDYLKLKKFSFVSLTGHADERGSDQLNMDLSAERLSAVASFLHDHGFHGKLELIPKGKTEPYTGVDRSKFALEELYQLDRRVELRLAQ